MMGRVTWESLPFPLPGRPNLVLTRDTSYKAKRAEVFTEMREMIGRGYELAGLSGGNEVMLIGGAKLYAALMPYVDRLYITEVDALIDGDAHFPAIMADEWSIVRELNPEKTDKDDYPFVIRIYERRK